MANYNTDKISGNYPARAGNGPVVVPFSMTVGTALAASDTITLAKIPAGAKVVELVVASNGTQSGADSVFTVGDAGDTARFITTAGGLAFRTGGGLSRLNAVGASKGIGYQYTSDTNVIATITTVGTGQTTGGLISGYIEYTMDF